MNPKLLVATAMLVATIGCSKDMTSPIDMMRTAGPAVVTSPADGGTIVEISIPLARYRERERAR